jgi:hypothetical protein
MLHLDHMLNTHLMIFEAWLTMCRGTRKSKQDRLSNTE